MIHYADTSFLCAAYRQQAFTELALALRETLAEPLHYTSLLEFAFLQAIEEQVWLRSHDKTKGFTRRVADGMIADWETDVASGVIQLVAFDMSAMLRLSLELSGQATAKDGNRSMDIFHVATAVHLGARKFLTFDDRQQALARRAGLEVVPG